MAGRRSKILLDAAVGSIAVTLLRAIRLADRRKAADFAAAFMRRAGPLLREHRIGRDNLRSAFPEKSDREIEKILAGVWDNLGRIAAEFVHLHEFHVAEARTDDQNAVVVDPATLEQGRRLIDSGKSSLIFACHTANWEISALVAKQIGANTAILYRRPNIPAIGDAVLRMRANVMGQLIATGLDAPIRLARLLQAGVHVGMLVDQHYTKGVDVTFFGRRCKANPLLAKLARQVECPIYGLRVVRLADRNRFSGDITGPIEPSRDAEGRIDVEGTMQAVTSVIEGWVREYPEQWMWVHRRWR